MAEAGVPASVTDYHTPLVSCETLYEHLRDPKWVVFDCRHDLTVKDKGRLLYEMGHIPGAYHAHLDDDLAAPPGASGRHPLPDPDGFRRFLKGHGVHEDSQIVCYDDAGGAYAARMWWLARHYGHPNVAVLDGGLARWQELDMPQETEVREPPGDGSFQGKPGSMPTIAADDLLAAAQNGNRLLDARAPERYLGELEPLDPKAGHIPGAYNLPFAAHVGPDGRFLAPDELRSRIETALGDKTAEDAIVYCGSGVTAAHLALAMEVADLGTPALYPGSWSEWCRPEAGRPVATGEEPR